MSRHTLTRLTWVVVGLVALVTAAFAIRPIMSGPEDFDLGPVVHNTHEPVPTESDTPDPETPSPTSQPVTPAPPVVVEDYDDDWDDDDDDWDEDDWDDDDDDDWDDDDD